ncbi:hypothetical protein I302_107077 [Kwoniella bestiolae CBS 10118]|uniref:Uncharacterized protein n=1 Tax=Kwoniella bestiolae CBS 10118 TaxID=1296100 RepID=A0AAJ8KCD9_9TREE
MSSIDGSPPKGDPVQPLNRNRDTNDIQPPPGLEGLRGTYNRDHQGFYSSESVFRADRSLEESHPSETNTQIDVETCSNDGPTRLKDSAEQDTDTAISERVDHEPPLQDQGDKSKSPVFVGWNDDTMKVNSRSELRTIEPRSGSLQPLRTSWASTLNPNSTHHTPSGLGSRNLTVFRPSSRSPSYGKRRKTNLGSQAGRNLTSDTSRPHKKMVKDG